MLSFHADRQQSNALHGLAYWVADEHFIRERYGNDDPEIQVCSRTINECIYPSLDRLHVPFWVQNAVSVFAENWRTYTSSYMDEYLRAKNIIIYPR